MAEKTTITPKKSRGRPKTAFVSKKPKVKQSGPWRPKKIQEINSITGAKPQFINKRLTENDSKKKDAVILIMFILSLVLFTASLFFSQKKDSIDTEQIPELPIENEIAPITQETTGEAVSTEQTWTMTWIQEESSTTNPLLGNFYTSLNNATMSEIYPNITANLKASKLFKIYFSKTRTQRFLKNLAAGWVQIWNIQSDNKANPTFTYTVSYTLQDGKAFEEKRRMQILEKEIPQIAKMMCINTGCSTFPFFNPGKYTIH